MKITDELRKYAQGYKNSHDAWSGIGEELDHIADRIDAEHERTFRNLTDALHKQEDATRELDEKSVLLPVDADGEVIHIGDRVENNERVVRIVLTDGSCEPSVYVEMLPNVLHEYFCNEISHYHEPTVEDVLLECCHKYHSLLIEDMNDAIAGVERDYIAPAEIIAEYAAKLRLAEVVDE